MAFHDVVNNSATPDAPMKENGGVVNSQSIPTLILCSSRSLSSSDTLEPLSLQTMESFAQKAGLKLFAKHLDQYKPADPLYETYTDKKGRTKRRKVDQSPVSFPRTALNASLLSVSCRLACRSATPPSSSPSSGARTISIRGLIFAASVSAGLSSSV
jgi:hypothetical protein